MDKHDHLECEHKKGSRCFFCGSKSSVAHKIYIYMCAGDRSTEFACCGCFTDKQELFS